MRVVDVAESVVAVWGKSSDEVNAYESRALGELVAAFGPGHDVTFAAWLPYEPTMVMIDGAYAAVDSADYRLALGALEAAKREPEPAPEPAPAPEPEPSA